VVTHKNREACFPHQRPVDQKAMAPRVVRPFLTPPTRPGYERGTRGETYMPTKGAQHRTQGLSVCAAAPVGLTAQGRTRAQGLTCWPGRQPPVR